MIPTATAHAKTVAAIALAALALLTLAACASPEPQVIEREVVREVEVVKEVEVQVVVTATPAPQPTVAPTPMPTNTPMPSPTPETTKPVAAPTPAPVGATSTPGTAPFTRRLPTATPAPTYTIEDYYVIINQGTVSDDGSGRAAIYESPEHIESGNGLEINFSNEDLFIDYLLSEAVITLEERNAYYAPVPDRKRKAHYDSDMTEFFDEKYRGNIKAPIRELANAVYKQTYDDGVLYLNGKKIMGGSNVLGIIKYADKSAVQADIAAGNSSGGNALPDETGYVVIRDGSIAVSGTSEDGVTTSVSIDTVDTGELLDYLLSQNKITVAQRDEYGRTGELELSLADTPDFFDWAISSDEGVQVGINEEGIDYIRNNILPLFGGE